jgi:hypothetical protein
MAGKTRAGGPGRRVAHSDGGAKAVIIECGACAYEPTAVEAAALGRCPKCGSYSWRRFALSVRLLPGAQAAVDVRGRRRPLGGRHYGARPRRSRRAAR